MIDEQNNYHKLSNEDSGCDLGVLFKSNLKFDEHIDNTNVYQLRLIDFRFFKHAHNMNQDANSLL